MLYGAAWQLHNLCCSSFSHHAKVILFAAVAGKIPCLKIDSQQRSSLGRVELSSVAALAVIAR